MFKYEKRIEKLIAQNRRLNKKNKQIELVLKNAIEFFNKLLLRLRN